MLRAKHGNLLPAKKSILKQIVDNKQPYYQALMACDAGHSANQLQFLLPLENLVSFLLKEQLQEALS